MDQLGDPSSTMINTWETSISYGQKTITKPCGNHDDGNGTSHETVICRADRVRLWHIKDLTVRREPQRVLDMTQDASDYQQRVGYFRVCGYIQYIYIYTYVYHKWEDI